MKSKLKQSETEGYREGYHTGVNKGYKKGLEDALVVVQEMLGDYGITLKDSEFKIQYGQMVDDGDVTPPLSQS